MMFYAQFSEKFVLILCRYFICEDDKLLILCSEACYSSSSQLEGDLQHASTNGSKAQLSLTSVNV